MLRRLSAFDQPLERSFGGMPGSCSEGGPGGIALRESGVGRLRCDHLAFLSSGAIRAGGINWLFRLEVAIELGERFEPCSRCKTQRN